MLALGTSTATAADRPCEHRVHGSAKQQQAQQAPYTTTLHGCRPPCMHRGPVRWRSSLRNTIYDVLLSKKEWVETESETEWDFFWADKG